LLDENIWHKKDSMERDVLPHLIAEGQLHSHSLKENYWMDIGMPNNFLKGTVQYLNHLARLEQQYDFSDYG